MDKFCSRTLGIVLAATLSGCAPQPPAAKVTDTVHYAPPAINAWTGSEPTVVESYGQASPRQFGELRVPAGKGPFPVAMLIHGGCWANMGSPNNMLPIADWLRARGVATWNVDYREIASGGGWPGSFNDWAAGLAALKTLATRYPLDLTRITTFGHSAGALPASWLASGSQGDDIVAKDLPDVRAAVILDGPIELRQFRDVDDMICGAPVIDQLLGGTPETVPARYDMVDAVKNPPVVKRMVLVDGALPSHTPATLDFLRSRGVAIDVIMTDQQQHFDMLMPGTSDFEAYAPAMLQAIMAR